jgi:hypothetical protein
MSLETEFIPYEQALALRELGFDEPCFGFYIGDIIRLCSFTNYPCKNSIVPYDTQEYTVTAILYQQAFRFLLDQLEFVSITYFNDGSGNLKRIGEGIFFDFNNREDCLIELINQVKIKKQ